MEQPETTKLLNKDRIIEVWLIPFRKLNVAGGTLVTLLYKWSRRTGAVRLKLLLDKCRKTELSRLNLRVVRRNTDE